MALPTAPGGIKEIQEYRIELLQSEVPAFPGGPLVKVNGTVQEVVAQLRELNPHLDESIVPSPDTLQKRTDFTGALHHCHPDSNTGHGPEVEEGIAYLRKVRGIPSAGPGPASCARVSCSWNSAIVWCNDNPGPISLSSFGDIADGAQFLVDHCRVSFHGHPDIGGRVFHNAGWNVAVERADC